MVAQGTSGDPESRPVCTRARWELRDSSRRFRVDDGVCGSYPSKTDHTITVEWPGAFAGAWPLGNWSLVDNSRIARNSPSAASTG